MSPQILSLIVFAENIHLNLNRPTKIAVCAPGLRQQSIDYNKMINLIKLRPSLSIVLVAFHATEIQCVKQGLRSYASLRSAKCQATQILITIDYFNSLRFFHFRVASRGMQSLSALLFSAMFLFRFIQKSGQVLHACVLYFCPINQQQCFWKVSNP